VKSNKRIVMGGEGGQGVQAVADIMALAAYEEGKEALYIPNFGIEQRGGVSLAFVQIGPEPIGSPKFKEADLLIALSGRALERMLSFLNQDCVILYDSSLLAPPEVSDEVVGRQAYNTIAPEAFAERGQTARKQEFPEIKQPFQALYGLPAGEIARQKIHPRVANMIILGAATRLTGIVEPDSVKKALQERLANKIKRDPNLLSLNIKAFELGWESTEFTLKSPVAAGTTQKR
jgi:2-oxoglutarate ferredoxin oxidoreductase subunit gamma